MSRTLKPKEIDFLLPYRRKLAQESGKGGHGWVKWALPPVLLALLFAVLFGWYEWQAYTMRRDIRDIDTYLSDDQVAAQYGRAQQLARELARYTEAYGDIQDIRAAITSYPEIGAAGLNKVLACRQEGITLRSFSYDRSSATLSIEGSAPSYAECPPFIDRLKATDLFDHVTYNGYNSRDSRYEFHAYCRLKGVGSDE